MSPASTATTADSRVLSPPPSALFDGASLFLDFDGTLVGLADRPDAIIVDPDLTALLVRLSQRLDGRLALVSGRSLDQLEFYLGQTIKVFTLVGSHGAETRLASGSISRPTRSATLDLAAEQLRKRFPQSSGVVVENKSFGVALHYRLCPDQREEACAAANCIAAANGLLVQHGKMMVELRLRGHDKGGAIKQLSTIPPFVDHHPVFIGDDLTDESGFVICAALGGAGIVVGEARDTAARYYLADVAAVLHCLDEVAA